jgi:HPt (histidine-containing phosphotransfer) domain-containing protein
VREATSLAALCELAEETAGGGDLGALRARLAELRETEAPDGIEAAEEAAAALEDAIEPPPRVATTAYLDALGVAARRLEQTLGEENGSPFAVALQQALPAIEELAAEVERTYKGPLA